MLSAQLSHSLKRRHASHTTHISCNHSLRAKAIRPKFVHHSITSRLPTHESITRRYAKRSQRVTEEEEEYEPFPYPLYDHRRVAAPKQSFFDLKPVFDRIRERRLQFMLEYGCVGLFLHEVIGLASYGLAAGLIWSGLIPLDSVHALVLEKLSVELPLTYLGFSDTALYLVKYLDLSGLAVVRWVSLFIFTPLISVRFGAALDRLMQRKISKKTLDKWGFNKLT